MAGTREEQMPRSVSKSELTAQDVAQILEDFLEGSRVSSYSWDGFTLGMSFADEALEGIRIRCAGLGEEFPSEDATEYCNEQGREVIRGYVRELRNPI